jgi:hypothetical protein
MDDKVRELLESTAASIAQAVGSGKDPVQCADALLKITTALREGDPLKLKVLSDRIAKVEDGLRNLKNHVTLETKAKR